MRGEETGFREWNRLGGNEGNCEEAVGTDHLLLEKSIQDFEQMNREQGTDEGRGGPPKDAHSQTQ